MKIQRIKQHFKDNKKSYIACGITAVVTGVTVFLLGRNTSSAEIVQKAIQVGYKNKVNQTVIKFIELSTPSKPVHLKGTNLYFNSISEASRKTGHSVSMISRNVNGHIPDVKGDIFELLELAA